LEDREVIRGAILAAFLFFSAACGGAPADRPQSLTGAWSKPPSASGDKSVPGPRADAIAFFDGGKLFLYGGYVALPVTGGYDTCYPSDLWSFDQDSSAWTKLPAAGNEPPVMMDRSFLWTGEAMLQVGGVPCEPAMRRFEPQPLHVWTLSRPFQTWTEKTRAIDAPSGRRKPWLVWTGAEILLLGGVSADQHQRWVNDLWKYEPRVDRWTCLDAGEGMPTLRKWPKDQIVGVFWAHDRLVVLGSSIKSGFDDVWVFDLKAKKWTALPQPETHPPYRCCPAAAVGPDGRIILFGGYQGGEMGGSVSDYLDDAWALDILSNQWTKIRQDGDIPSSRMMAACAMSQRSLYLFGGVRRLVFSSDLRKFSFQE
jgi:N-acetylneuraminic acid mutarotase